MPKRVKCDSCGCTNEIWERKDDLLRLCLGCMEGELRRSHRHEGVAA